jgi:YegS/Rv2252/BmrU family lipid kinase
MTGVKRRAAFVLNPAAGVATGEEEAAAFVAALSEHFVVDVFSTCRERDADVCARAALATKPDVVVACGGDGTVSMTASALIGSGVPLGILARGTSNSIGGGLGIPSDPAAAIDVIANGEPRVVDTARANGRTMLLHASVGFQAATVASTPRDAKNRWGLLAYLKEGVVQLADLAQFHVEIATEKATVRCRAVNVTVANVAPAKTVLAQGPAAVIPDDGALDITIVAASTLGDVVLAGLHLLTTAALGEAATRDNVGYLSARRVRLTVDPPQALLVDGEVVEGDTLEIECVPASLTVMTPKSVVTDEPPAPTSAPETKLEGLPALDVDAPKIKEPE